MDRYLEVFGGLNLRKRQTVFFLFCDTRNESHKDPEYIDFSVPRLARYMHKAWKRHQNAIDLGIREGLNVLSNKIECNYSSGKIHSPLYCNS